RWPRDWSSDVCSSDLGRKETLELRLVAAPDGDTRAGELVARLGERHYLLDVGCDLRRELRRQRARREEALPQRRRVIGQALFGEIGRASCRERVEMCG